MVTDWIGGEKSGGEGRAGTKTTTSWESGDKTYDVVFYWVGPLGFGEGGVIRLVDGILGDLNMDVSLLWPTKLVKLLSTLNQSAKQRLKLKWIARAIRRWVFGEPSYVAEPLIAA
ncbi:hypothetical protein Ancab_020525 [Ancistrocladus abbreviatus]